VRRETLWTGGKQDPGAGAREIYILKRFVIVTAHQILFRLTCKGENEMGGACSTNGGVERCIQGFDGEF
jgi:hypothetical protein